MQLSETGDDSVQNRELLGGRQVIVKYVLPVYALHDKEFKAFNLRYAPKIQIVCETLPDPFLGPQNFPLTVNALFDEPCAVPIRPHTIEGSTAKCPVLFFMRPDG